MTKVAINGFGRIGRLVLRSALKNHQDLDFVAVNDLTSPETLAHLFKFDSVHGIFDGEVKVEGDSIVVNGKKIKVLSERDPEALPWKELGIDIVVESTGLFRDKEKAEKHLKAGAKKVVISAPAKNEDITIVLGVNEKLYDNEKHNVISNASCTTNCLAPVVKVINDNFGIESALMCTIHSYTNDQKILDLPHKDLRRARAAGMSMIPTTTGAAKAVALVLPELKGKIDGYAMRVPTPNVSIVDTTFIIKKATTEEEVNNAIKKASMGELKGILGYEPRPLVSRDFYGDSRSSIYDAGLTKVINGTMIKCVSWYDNEWGYSCRVVDLIKHITK